MMKTHLNTSTGPLCGRGRIVTDSPRMVTCGVCQTRETYRKPRMAEDEQRENAFQAPTPRTVVPPFGRFNDDGFMECFACGGVLWRERPRSLHSYHYVCADCGQSVFPMTETGMCT